LRDFLQILITLLQKSNLLQKYIKKACSQHASQFSYQKTKKFMLSERIKGRVAARAFVS